MKTGSDMIRNCAETGAEIGSKVIPGVGNAGGGLIGASVGAVSTLMSLIIYGLGRK